MPKFCFVGDLHFEALDKYYAKETNPNRFIFEQLTKVIQYCRKAEVKHIFQLGDVFDHPYPDQKSIKEFLAFLHMNSDINFYIIAGNHDYSNIKTTSLEVGTFLSDTKLLSNVKIFTKAHHEVVEGINIFFAPYPVFAKFDYLANVPCLCLGHFEVKGAKHDSGQIIKNGVPLENLNPEDHWVLGHLHRQQTLNAQTYYTGTMLQYNFGEPLPKGFTLSTIEDKTDSLQVNHSYIELETPYILENVDINTQEDFNRLQLNNPQYFYKLFIEGTNLVIPQKLLNGSVSNIYKIIRAKSSLTVDASGVDQSLSEAFHQDADKEKLFEPLGGLEDFLTSEGFSSEDTQYTLEQVNKLQLEFNPKRN